MTTHSSRPDNAVSDPSEKGGAQDDFWKALVDEQQTLGVAEMFARAPVGDATARHLIPLTRPRPGEQYAFDVDLDRCSGCKGCVTACHNLNGLDEDEVWREVGVLFASTHREAAQPPNVSGCRSVGAIAEPIQHTVTTACHHCVEPACLLGCPVLAYEKDSITGIVHHLDDQCIGCSYCVMTCPYEVPKFSARRGIVRKCDMCHQRLAVGEAPACVQGCPNEAIRIEKVSVEWVALSFKGNARRSAGVVKVPEAGSDETDRVENAVADVDADADSEVQAGDVVGSVRSVEADDEPGESVWLADAPDPAITLPTTRYRIRSPVNHSALFAADHADVFPAPAHGPLVAMLLLTQFGVGGFIAAALHSARLGEGRVDVGLLIAAWSLFAAGLLVAPLHLGKPLKAWRAFLGWRTSWLSREILMFQLVGGLATGALLLAVASSSSVDGGGDGVVVVGGVFALGMDLLRALVSKLPEGIVSWGLHGMLWATGVAGLLAVWVSVRVYAVTQRAYWSNARTGLRFLGTTAMACVIGLLWADAIDTVLGVALVVVCSWVK